MKQTPLYSRHKGLNARLAEFAGFEMPIQYTGIVEEHLFVRRSAAMFDVSHMGVFLVNGIGAKAFLQDMVTGNLDKIAPGKVFYTVLCNERGGAVDDLFVACIENGLYMLIVNASNVDKDFKWLSQHSPAGVGIENFHEKKGIIAVQGPDAVAILDRVCVNQFSNQGSFTVARNVIAGKPVVLTRTGYTGEDGAEIYIDTQDCPRVWDALAQAGVKPAGLGARDTLRLEMGYSLYGHEIDETTNVLEAGLGWVVDLEDKLSFIGREALVASKKIGLKLALVGLLAEGKGIPRQGCQVMDSGTIIGRVTSGGYSPVLERGIALAYVERTKAVMGSHLSVDVRGKSLPVTVVKRKFINGK